MAEPLPTERLQPALLDRLTDNEPESRVEAREARVLTKSQLRAAVLRDLASLMNSTRASAMLLEATVLTLVTSSARTRP